TSDFNNRKPRSLLKRCKAIECRTFLLYTEPVLKSVLSHNKYLNFITLHGDYAELFLHYYVKTFIILYGKENTYHLLHLC
ncbi:hypothetical protein EAG_09160, partial [Camponotus floridanus]